MKSIPLSVKSRSVKSCPERASGEAGSPDLLAAAPFLRGLTRNGYTGYDECPAEVQKDYYHTEYRRGSQRFLIEGAKSVFDWHGYRLRREIGVWCFSIFKRYMRCALQGLPDSASVYRFAGGVTSFIKNKYVCQESEKSPGFLPQEPGGADS